MSQSKPSCIGMSKYIYTSKLEEIKECAQVLNSDFSWIIDWIERRRKVGMPFLARPYLRGVWRLESSLEMFRQCFVEWNLNMLKSFQTFGQSKKWYQIENVFRDAKEGFSQPKLILLVVTLRETASIQWWGRHPFLHLDQHGCIAQWVVPRRHASP